MMTTDERHRDMLRKELESHGFSDWTFGRVNDDENENVKIELGRWRCVQPVDAMQEGEEGDMHAEVVGSLKYNNERVAFFFAVDGSEEEVMPFDDIEPLG
jgi:hypothetical protein